MTISQDTVSESWCSVHLTSPTSNEPLQDNLKIPQQQRVVSWLATHHHHHHHHHHSSQPETLHRSYSESSLADFLACTGPYRPSFMDDRHRPKRRVKERTKRKVGWVATKLADGPLSFASQTSSMRVHTSGSQASSSRDEEEEEKMVTNTTTTDAEFLSHAFNHFVTFQPLDFDRQYRGRIQLTEREEEPKDGVWSYIAKSINDATRDITFFQ